MFSSEDMRTCRRVWRHVRMSSLFRLSKNQPLRQACYGLKEKLVPIIPTGALYMHLQGALVGRIAPNPPDSCPGGALRATRPTSAAGRAALIKRPLHPYSRISGVFLNCGNGFPRVSPIVFRGEKISCTSGDTLFRVRRFPLQGTPFPSSGDKESPLKGRGMSLQGAFRFNCAGMDQLAAALDA